MSRKRNCYNLPVLVFCQIQESCIQLFFVEHVELTLDLQLSICNSSVRACCHMPALTFILSQSLCSEFSSLTTKLTNDATIAMKFKIRYSDASCAPRKGAGECLINL